MKIVSLKEFLKLPNGTIFIKYWPYVFGRLAVKEESVEETQDFCFTYITDEIEAESEEDLYNKLDQAEKTGCSVEMSFSETMRDGLFEDKQLFAVFEKQDINGLLDKLQECLKLAYK